MNEEAFSMEGERAGKVLAELGGGWRRWEEGACRVV